MNYNLDSIRQHVRGYKLKLLFMRISTGLMYTTSDSMFVKLGDWKSKMSGTGTQCVRAQARLAIQEIEFDLLLHSTGNQANWELKNQAKKRTRRPPIRKSSTQTLE